LNGDWLALGAAGLLAAASGIRRGSRSWDEDTEEWGDPSPLEITSIPVGTLLYHGTQATEEFEDLIGPAWLSDDKAVATRFTAWNEEGGRHRVLVYKTTVAIDRLVMIRTPQDMARLIRAVHADEYDGPPEIADAACDAGYNGWHIPNNYPSGSDTMLCEPESWLEFVEEITA
jgi:hypothetical protein